MQKGLVEFARPGLVRYTVTADAVCACSSVFLVVFGWGYRVQVIGRFNGSIYSCVGVVFASLKGV